MKHIGQNIKRMAEEQNISIHMLEQKAGLKRSAIYNIISDLSQNPTIYTLMQVAKAFNCPISHLFLPFGPSQLDISEPIYSYEEPAWNSQLYVECLNSLIQVAKGRRVFIPRKVFLKLGDELYAYCLKANLNQIDKDLADIILEKWLVSNFSETP